MAKTDVAPSQFTKEFALPEGAKLTVKKPTNGIRRSLIELPETQLRFIIEIIAAACIVKMELPAGYSEEYPDGTTLEFGEDSVKDAWARLDKLGLLDTQAYIEVFQETNIPSPEMIKSLLDAAKAGKR